MGEWLLISMELRYRRLASGRIKVFKLLAESFTANAADNKPLFRITQQFLCPVNGAAVNEFPLLTGRSNCVNVKAEIEIVVAPARALFVKYTRYTVELRADRGQKLSLDQLDTRIRL